jgi:hypothetical protein
MLILVKVFRFNIVTSSGYGVLLELRLTVFSAAGFIIFLLMSIFLFVRFVKTKIKEAENAEFSDDEDRRKQVDVASREYLGFEFDDSESGNETRIIHMLKSMRDRIFGGNQLEADLIDRLDSLVSDVEDVIKFKKQLVYLEKMAYSAGVRSNVEFILKELSNVGIDVCKIVLKSKPAFEYYYQYLHDDDIDADQYRNTALVGINKCVSDVDKLTGYCRDIINMLDKAVGEDQVEGNNSIQEAETLLEALRVFVKKERIHEEDY